jgi:hypothetical protein
LRYVELLDCPAGRWQADDTRSETDTLLIQTERTNHLIRDWSVASSVKMLAPVFRAQHPHPASANVSAIYPAAAATSRGLRQVPKHGMRCYKLPRIASKHGTPRASPVCVEVSLIAVISSQAERTYQDCDISWYMKQNQQRSCLPSLTPQLGVCTLSSWALSSQKVEVVRCGRTPSTLSWHPCQGCQTQGTVPRLQDN